MDSDGAGRTVNRLLERTDRQANCAQGLRAQQPMEDREATHLDARMEHPRIHKLYIHMRGILV